MKKFVLKSVLFLAICSVLDVFVGLASSALQRSSKGGLTQKDEYIKNKMNADIVIMGSSRASHHYVSNLIADSLRCSVYNAGMDGKGIIMNYGILLEITRRYTPKMIIYDLTPEFDWINGDNEKYLSHLRHAYDIRGIDSVFWYVNPNERIKMISNSYRSNSLLPHFVYDNIVADNDTLRGYVPLYNRLHRETTIRDDSTKHHVNYPIDPLKAKYLQKMIDLCKERNINLIFAISPILEYSENMYSYGLELGATNKIMIIDFHDMKSDYKEELFQDAFHLNNEGATKYTLEVINSLKN